ncbi:MAG: Fic family protein, partial [Bacteroidetes bacterium]|nr:Fic family protein [Bacteroidota bacterium]
KDGEILIPNLQHPEPLVTEFNHFVACIRGEEEPLTDAHYAANVVSVLEAAQASIVKKEFESFWTELDEVLKEKLRLNEIFYFASLIHLVFGKIHPFNDGNGRTARLLEKWFMAEKLGEKSWYIGSEFYYYNNLKEYYSNLEKVGIFYERLEYEKALPFLLMLPKAIELNNYNGISN